MLPNVYLHPHLGGFCTLGIAKTQTLPDICGPNQMKMTRKTTLATLLAIVAPALLWSQSKLMPINVSLFNESTAIPFTRFITTPVHPGIQVGTEFDYTSKAHTRLFQTANVSYFYHNYLAQGIGIHTELGYECRASMGLALTGLLGLGYMHTFATTEEFTHNNGQYEKKSDKGNARLIPSLSFDIGYYLRCADAYSPKIYLRYQAWAEYPYSPDFIPVLTHINLHAGVKFFIACKTTGHE